MDSEPGGIRVEKKGLQQAGRAGEQGECSINSGGCVVTSQ